MSRSTRCLLCQRQLQPVPGTPYQQHEPVLDCEVAFTDAWGIAVDLDAVPETPAPATEAPPAPAPKDPDILVQRFTPFEVAHAQVYKGLGLSRLGGPSSGRGWSSVGLFQACRYAWFRRYVSPPSTPAYLLGENEPLTMGSLVHALLAAHYVGMIEGHPHAVVTPDLLYAGLLDRGCNPELVTEGWRLFTHYRLHYQGELFQPLAVEYDLKDPRTGASTRYDAIVYLAEDQPGLLAGTYIMEHKTASRFDYATLNGWFNEGEILGEVGHYQALRLEKRFGPLRGVIVNIVGKQQEPKFHRTLVAPSMWQLEGHFADLRVWEAEIQHALATNLFPRSRRACVSRYGLCEHFTHCQTGEP